MSGWGRRRVLFVVLLVVGLGAFAAGKFDERHRASGAAISLDRSAEVATATIESELDPVQSTSSDEVEPSEQSALPPKKGRGVVVCDGSVVDSEDGRLVAIYRVKDGELGELCHGVASEVTLRSWAALREFTTPADLVDIRLFAGIESDTLAAFVGPIWEDQSTFVLAVDLLSAVEDEQELRVTMAHELSHVFTQDENQVNEALVRDQCATYYNGFVCFLPESYIAAWVEAFWTPEQIADLPPTGTIDEDGGEQRCTVDPSFLGSYAASHPEEDFAEAFSAFVFAVEVSSQAEERIRFFEAYPELVVFRDRAAAAGQQDLPNNFDRCG